MPASVQRSVDVDASPERVWALLSEFAAISRWAPNVDHSSLMTEQVSGVGTVRRIQTGGAVVLETIESWEPGVELSYRITGLPPVIKELTNTWQLDEASSGTRVTLTTHIDAGPRPPQQLVAKAVGRKLAEASDQMLAGLLEALEQPSGQQEENQ